MNFAQIKSFLAIVECKNISKAGELLYLSQSTISNQLKQLEKELSVQLIIRKRGHNVIELTPKGEEFIPIARKWVSLYKNTKSLSKTDSYPTLNVGSIDSLNLYVFSSLYNQILNEGLPLNLSINSYHYTLLYRAINNNEIDIGFANYVIRYDNIVTTPIFKEEMYLITNSNSNYENGCIHPSNLDTKNELFISWGVDYESWHDYWWDPTDKPYISINAPSFIFNFLNYNTECWVIVPASIAKIFSNNENFKVHELLDPPPGRVCYKITRRSDQNDNKLQLFETYLTKYLNSLNYIILNK